MTVSFLPAGTEFWVIWPLLAILVVVPVWRICRRIGYSPLLALLMLIPLANLVLLWAIAYGRWPATDDARSKRRPSV